MEPEPEVRSLTVEDAEQAEGVPPAEEMDLATFLRSCTNGVGTAHSIKWQPEEFGSAVRGGFAALWAAVSDAGSALTEGCDVIAIVEKRVAGELLRTEKYSCHSLVLTVWSPVIRASLEERWSSKLTSGPTSLQIDLGPAEPVDFKTMLCYCYTGELVLTASNVIGLLHLSDFYGIDPVKNCCGEFLFGLLGNEQLAALLAIAEEYNVAQLRRACASVLADDFENLLEDGTLWSLSVDVWEELLAQTSLAVSEETTVLDAVLTFASPPHTHGAEERAAKLERLLPYVRLPQLGERLITVQQDLELMAIPEMSTLVIRALTKLAFPNASEPEQLASTTLHAAAKLHAIPRLGLSSFDPLYTSANFDVSNKRRTAKITESLLAMTHQQQSFLVVQPAVVSTARWLVSIDSLPSTNWTVNIWVCIDSDVLAMTPSSPNPTSTVYAIYQSQQTQATLANAMGASQHVPAGGLTEGDVVTVELKERNGVHLVGFLKNGVKSGSPLQLEYPGMAVGRRTRRQARGFAAAPMGTERSIKWRLLISTMPCGSNFSLEGQGVGDQQHDVQFSLMRREPDRDSDE